MKTLITIPIIHSAADLGSLAEAVRTRYLEQLGPDVWDERELLVTRLWEEIGKRLAQLPLGQARTRIYQDGLPVCEHELEIVQELAAAGSFNHQLILQLVERGAILMGTEDPQLLIQEYQMHCRQLAAAASPGGLSPELRAEAVRLLEARDRFIARRIVDTLQDSEMGLLLLGAAHRIDRLELPEIEVHLLDVCGPAAQ